MLPRQPLPVTKAHSRGLPQRWLMTDRRLGNRLPQLVAAMPPRSGVIIRPHAMEKAGQAAMIRAIRRVARARRHCLLIAGRRAEGFDGVHAGGPVRLHGKPRASRLLSLPVHDRREADRARRVGADLCLVSPVATTRSHPDARPLGIRGLALLAAGLTGTCCVIALGGMDASRFRRLRGHHAHGWAAIDAWQPKG